MTETATRGELVQVTVDEVGCTGCGVCVRVCPQQILALHTLEVPKGKVKRQVGVLNVDHCIGCFGCEDECSFGAIRVRRAPQREGSPTIEPRPDGFTACDVVIVGAGPAGLGAATTCAKAGLSTVALERLPNRKLSHHSDGGVLFSLPWITDVRPSEDELSFPALDITLKAKIAKQCHFLGLLGPDGLSTNNEFPPGLDAWAGNKDTSVEALVNEAETHGAKVVFDAKVVDVLREGARVSGLKLADGTEVHAKLTIAADGVFAKLSEKAGFSVDKKDPWYANIMALEYNNTEHLPAGLYYLNGQLDLEEGMPITFGGVGITEVIHVIIVFLSKKRYYPGDKPMEHYAREMLARDTRVREKLGNTLDGVEPTILTGCRVIFRGNANTDLVRDGVLSIGDAWVHSGELGNIPALANGVFAARVAVEAFEKGDLSPSALQAVSDFANPKLVSFLGKNRDMKLLPTRITPEEEKELFRFMQHMNYPVLLFGNKRQQAGMFSYFMLRNALRFVRHPKIARLMM